MYPFSALILDDHAFQRLVAVQAMQGLVSGPILQASEGAEALEQLTTHGAVDILLCDIQMPGMDGLAFIRAVSERGLARSVILCSEIAPELRHSVMQMVDLLGLPLLGDLGKPLRIVKLAAMLRRFEAKRHESGKTLPALIELPSQVEVQRALVDGEFEAHYQPKLDLISGRPLGAEVLARWRHPRRGVLGPQHFLTAVLRYGQLGELFEQLLEQGLALAGRLRAEGRPLPLAFNLDAEQLSDRKLCTGLAEGLKRHRLLGSDLTFEITESSMLHAPATSLENLVRLRLMGCGVSVDDFGTGFSSLKRLCEMPCNELKLDASFIRGMIKHERYRAAVASTLAFAHTLNLHVVAEGIETVEQLTLLRSLGGTCGQGFLLAKPLAEEQLLAWLKQASATAC
ncbi:EAL domain-containing protein [Pseudomonas cavernicola]|uniref:EAL domain-containing response regulator n=1 Tax=Pseudomonas cavernicola TaxID=2320866 RepID=UPI0013141526|nr:EAL domain-containing response regulator [Pseudomonas cavernicola]